jgi:hypothetical protein
VNLDLIEKGSVNIKMDTLLNKNVVFQFSYDDCSRNSGGVNKVIRAHQNMMNNKGITCFSFFPIKLVKEYSYTLKYWGMIVNGRYCGVVNTTWFFEAIDVIRKNGSTIREVFIHHLYNVCLPELEKILDKLDCEINFYLHDYYSICTSFNLMKNDEYYCGEPFILEQKCSSCCYYRDAKVNRKNIENFLKKYNKRLQVIAPSDSSANLWRKAYTEYNGKIIVVPHQNVNQLKKSSEWIEPEVITIAYLGVPQPHKGWNQWKEFTTKMRGNKRYRFVCLGIGKEELKNVKNVYVEVRDDELAMVRSLRKEHVDIAFLWSLCPETYSYTFYEALVAGAFILTNEDSGNIAAQIGNYHNGIVFTKENELYEFIENKHEELINQLKIFHLRNTNYTTVDNDFLSSFDKVISSTHVDIPLNSLSCKFINLLYTAKINLKSI